MEVEWPKNFIQKDFKFQKNENSVELKDKNTSVSKSDFQNCGSSRDGIKGQFFPCYFHANFEF